MTSATVLPTCRISSRAVLDQWVEALGLELVFVVGEGDEVGHAELRLGDGWVMAGTARDNEHDTPLGSMSSYWVLDAADAVDALHARATAGGMESLNAPYAPGYGGRECSVRDADGNRWSFGTYAPGSSG